MNHLRQWSNDAAATRLGLEPAVLQQIAEVLVVASYRLNLPQQLQRIVETDKSSAAQLHAVIGNFVGWVTTRRLLPNVRQAVSVRGRQSLLRPWLAAPRRRATGNSLSMRPPHTYDWLVALYSRAIENIDYQHPHDVQPDARRALRALIM